MVTATQKLKNKFTKKTFSCPSCSKQLRVPIRPGKTLMVTCSRCQGQIQLSFKSPLSELFKWEKGRTFSYNLRMFTWRFKSLPMQFKVTLFLQLIVLVWIGQMLAGLFTGPKTAPAEPLPPKADYVRKI